MIEVSLPVAQGETDGTWVDMRTAFGQSMKDSSASGTIAQLLWPSAYDQAYATLEFADDDQGTNAGALYDTDGATILSQITKPAAGQRTVLAPANFCFAKYCRVKLPANASAAFTFKAAMRKVL